MESLKENKQLMIDARRLLSNHWSDAVRITLVFFIISFVLSFTFKLLISSLYSFLFDTVFLDFVKNPEVIKKFQAMKNSQSVMPKGFYYIKEWLNFTKGSLSIEILVIPFSIGYIIFLKNLTRNLEVNLKQLFSHSKKFFKCIGLFLVLSFYVFLWFLLLIIPGIIASYNYMLVHLVLVDNPNLSANQILKESKRLMVGNRWRFFCLQLRFLGWILLGILTLGIGFLWLTPYIQTSYILFYEDVKKQRSEKPLEVAS